MKERITRGELLNLLKETKPFLVQLARSMHWRDYHNNLVPLMSKIDLTIKQVENEESNT